MKKLLFVFTAFLVVMFCNTYKVEAADNSIWLHGKEFTWTDNQTIITVGGTQVLICPGKIYSFDRNSSSQYTKYMFAFSGDLWTYSNGSWNSSQSSYIIYYWTDKNWPATVSYTSDVSKVGSNYLGDIASCPYAEEPPVRFDPDVAYVTKCYGYEKYFQSVFDKYAKVELGIDLSNTNFDRIEASYFIAFPTSDLVLMLEDNGYSYIKTLPEQVYDFLISPKGAELIAVPNLEIFDKRNSYWVPDNFFTTGKYFSKVGMSSSYTLTASMDEIIKPDQYSSFSVWGLDNKYFGWIKHFQLVSYIYEVRITCYKDDVPGPTTVVKFPEIGAERYSLNYNPAKAVIVHNGVVDSLDPNSDDYKLQESQSAAEIEREYQQEQHRQEILDKEIADAAGVGSIGGSLNGIVSEIPSMTSGIQNAVAALFAPFNYLPAEIRGLFLATVIILCAIAIIKFIRG